MIHEHGGLQPHGWGFIPSKPPCIHEMANVNLELDNTTLEPLVRLVVEQTISRLEEARGVVPERIAFSEPEAAQLLGLEVHQLRDERLRGRIKASQIVGRRIRYLRCDLIDYLTSRRWERE